MFAVVIAGISLLVIPAVINVYFAYFLLRAKR